jgi:microcin C transport system substrate-binding protein
LDKANWKDEWLMMKRFGHLARLVAIGAAALTTALPAAAAERSHGLSIFGDLKYGPDFKHFEYVNPVAPKGGRMSTIGGLAFDSFNPFILKGDQAAGLSLLFDSLMASSSDEPNSAYGLVAHSVERSDDRKSITFFMRPEAKFSDGTPVTAEDVVFSFNTLKAKGHPVYRFGVKDVEKAEALDKHTVKYTFGGARLRDLPLTVAGLPILSKAYYAKIDFTKTSLVPPVGSGGYLLADYKSNTFVEYKRRKDYWAKDLPVNIGRYNFDTLRFNYYKDRTAWFLGLTSGEYDFGEEYYSKRWATEYDSLPAIKSKRMVRLTIPDATPSGTQGWFFNTRREKLSDPRVRKAIGYAFDFQWSNKNLFYDLYNRTTSYFQNASDMMASGKPSPEELALLEPFRDKLPAEVFGEVETSPVSDGSGRDRKMLRKADNLLREAGWTLKNRKRVNAKGVQLTLEFLENSPSFHRIIAPFIKNLQLLGIDAKIRPVDAPQLQRRVKSFDFDIATSRFVMSLTPGNELHNYFSSESAASNGSRNLAGIKSPVIDALLEKVMEAKSRTEVNVAVRALDRVLRAGNYWVPHWNKAAHNLAFWDRFSRPKIKPKYSRGVLDTWWYDKEKAAKIAK